MTLPTATLRTGPSAAALWGVYQRDFDFTTGAANLYLEFDAATYADAAHLTPNEDARQGLSLRVVVTGPDGAVEGDAQGYPAYVENGFEFTPKRPGEAAYNYYPTFDTFGRFRYAFQKVAPAGTPYTCRLYLYDAAAPAGQLCATWTVTVTDAGLAGRVRPCSVLSSGDPRRLQTQRQAAAALAGAPNDALAPLCLKGSYTDYDAYRSEDAPVALGQTPGVPLPVMRRLWAGSRTGCAVFGGYHFDDGGSAPRPTLLASCGNPATCYTPLGPLPANARGGRYWFRVGPNEQFDARVALKAATAYTLTFQVAVQASDRAAGAGAGVYGQCLVDGDFANITNGATVTVASMTNATLYSVSLTVPAKSPHGAGNYIERFLLKTVGITAGYVYIGGCTVQDPAGRDVYLEGDWSWHVRPNRRCSADLDQIMAAAEARGTGFRLLMFDKSDASFCQVQSDGTSAYGWVSDRTYGQTTASDSAIPVRRWQRSMAAYLAARWGSSPALWMVEGQNEADIANGNHVAFTQSLGAALHRWLPGLPVTSSTSWNSGGVDYNLGFYEGGQILSSVLGVTVGGAVPARLPDVSCSDEHNYDYYSGGYAANELRGNFPGHGWGAAPGAGPNGETTYFVSAAAAAPFVGPSLAQAEIQFIALRLQGAGAWQVRYFLRGSGGVQQSGGDRFTVKAQPFNGGAFVAFRADAGAAYFDPSGAPVAAPPANADFGWVEVVNTLLVPDGAYYTFGDVQGFRVNPGRLTAGRFDLYDLRLVDPQGRVWYRFVCDENWTDLDLTEKARSIGRMYGGWQNLGVGQPYTAGEAGITDLRHVMKPGATWNGSASDPNLVVNAIWADDAAGHAAEELAANGLNPGAFLPVWWDPIPAYYRADGTRYRPVAAVNALLAGVGTGGGTHNAADCKASDRNLLAMGTWDAAHARGALLVRSRPGHAVNQTYFPGAVSPVTGTVVLRGDGTAPLADGQYRVCYWPLDAPFLVGGAAAPLSQVTLAASGGALAIPVAGLSSRVGVTVQAVAGQVTAVTPSPASATVPGGQTLQFGATVQGVGTFTQAVTWAGAHFSAGGLFTAPAAAAAPQSFTGTAASADDPTVTAQVTVTVPAAAAPPPVGLIPWLTYERRFRNWP